MQDEFNFDEQTHTYYLNGLKIPSVTKVLQDAGLVKFFGNATENSRKFGDAMHLMTHYDDLGTLDVRSLDNNLKPYLLGYRKFLQKEKIVIIESELRGYSKKYLFGWTLDKVGIKNGVKTIIDLKSGVINKLAVNLQTAAYKIGYNEYHKKDKAVKRGAVQLLPNDYKYVQFDDKTDESVFLAFLTTMNYKKLHNIK